MAEQISERLDAINTTLKELIEVLRKPKESKIIKYMEFGVLFVGVFGIIQLIDVVIKSVTGG